MATTAGDRRQRDDGARVEVTTHTQSPHTPKPLPDALSCTKKERGQGRTRVSTVAPGDGRWQQQWGSDVPVASDTTTTTTEKAEMGQ